MKSITLRALAVLAVSVSLALSGCTKPPAPGTQSGAGGGTGDSVSIKGSDTMVHLVAKWAEAYRAAAPESNVAVTGGGSGTGIAALLNGTTNICMASRNMSEKELADAAAKGHAAVEIPVALDGIAIAVHKSNPLTEISLEQLAQIYTGAAANWKDVGGPDLPIVALSRESSSGTYVFFQEHVLNKQDYGVNIRLMPATSAMVQGVEADAGAIGYIGLGYAHGAADKVKILPVKVTADGPAVSATVETVRSKEYSIARALYFYTAGEATGASKAFIDFCLSPEGQKIVEEDGYVALK